MSIFNSWCQIVRCQIVWRQIVLQSSNLDHPRTQTHDPISPDQLQCVLDCRSPVGNQRGRCELGWDELRDWEPVGDMAFVYNSYIVQCKTKIKMYKKIARASLFFHLPLIIYHLSWISYRYHLSFITIIMIIMTTWGDTWAACGKQRAEPSHAERRRTWSCLKWHRAQVEKNTGCRLL